MGRSGSAARRAQFLEVIPGVIGRARERRGRHHEEALAARHGGEFVEFIGRDEALDGGVFEGRLEVLPHGQEIDPREEALLCQRAEQAWAGVPCGVMDQMAAIMSREGHALLIDCRTMETQHVPMPSESDAALVLFNTNVKHALAAGEYARRRAACETATRALGVESLRDVTLETIDAASSALSDHERRCARHVVTENQRTLMAADALRSGDLAEFGRLMSQSHASLRDDMRISCQELDTLVELASACEGVYGARMTGAGFGGCTISLVDREEVETFSARLLEEYQQRCGLQGEVIVSSPAEGACGIEL